MTKHLLRLFALTLALSLIVTLGVQATHAAPGDDLILTGVIDGPLTGGTPKAVELYVVNDIPDLSIYGLGFANNGGGSDGQEYTFPADAATAGSFIYVASENTEFANWFGFAPTYVGNPFINGDDAVELFTSGVVTDVFGDIDVDGNGEPWEYLDGWAYRVSGTGPDGSTFVLSNWFFSGPNALDGETSNEFAEIPFPTASYTPPVAGARVVINEFEPKGTEWIELYNAGAVEQDLTGWTLTDDTGNSEPLSGTLAAGAYLEFDTSLSLSNSGDIITLLDDEANVVDQVGYGVSGGAPLMNVGFSTARLFDGVDTGDDARDWNLDATPTRGSANDVADTALGSSLLINEMDLFPADSGPDKVELYNPGASAVDITGWGISDGDELDMLTGSVPAGGFVVLEEGVDFTGDFGGADVAYLYNAARERVDQLGWTEGPFFNFCIARVPDGAGPNDGFNWDSSGGDVTLFDQACTLGDSNTGDTPDPLVINEILADPHPDDPPADPNGDANGDGVRDSSEDEFLELVNVSGSDLDLSGWTISDGVALRHTFPADTIVPDNCAVVVFGGGAPTGAFGGSVVQTASEGFLGFNNGGDTVTVSDPGATVTVEYLYGSEGGDNQSLTRDPDIIGPEPLVKHTTVAAAAGAVHSPGTAVDGSAFSGCPAAATPATIMEIQGAAHTSPLEGTLVETEGVVTVLRAVSFYLQDPTGDGNDATSDGINVFVGGTPTVAVGDIVRVVGTVEEFYPGGIDTGNLSITQLGDPDVTVLPRRGGGIAPVVLGDGGRIPPDMIIDNDSTGEVGSGTFDPDEDGIDFYESLEGMLVQVNNAHVVGSNRFGEIVVVGDGGANATTLTSRGGIYITADDFNPERIIFDDGIVGPPPVVTVGDSFADPLIGVVDYSFGNFKVLNYEPLPPVTSGGVSAETTSLVATPSQLTVASFNVQNYSAVSDPAKTDGLAAIIVNNLQSPDIIGLQEIQDNSGTDNDGVVDAGDTYLALITAIQAAGGPLYDYRDIAPEDLQDGGVPGGNIRVGFLYNPARVTFVDRAGGDATTSTGVALGANGVELEFSPGRIDPTNTAWFESRKPLAGEFLFNGQTVIVVNNHFNSKGGDDALFGRIQPPVLQSEVQRLQQAQVINDFVDSVLALDTNANIIVLGDLNDFQFSPPIQTLTDGALTNLIDTLPENEQYTYIFDGNSQVLDHILLGNGMASATAPEVDVVHTVAEFNSDGRATDHDPVVTRVLLPDEPTAVTLADLGATVTNGAVNLYWTTAAEVNTQGFRVYRSADADGPFELLTAELIASMAGAGGGASYSFSDTPTAGVWYYLLEDVSGDGVATQHPVVAVDTTTPTAVNLTAVTGDALPTLLPLALAALAGAMLLLVAGWRAATVRQQRLAAQRRRSRNETDW